MPATNHIAEILLSKNILSPQQLEAAQQDETRTGRSLLDIVFEKGFAREKQVAQALSEQLGLAFVDLEKYTIEEGIVRSLPQEAILKFQALPLFKGANSVTVAMVNPSDEGAVAELGKLLKTKVRPVVATASQIKSRLKEEHQKQAPANNPASESLGGGVVSDSEKVAGLASVIGMVDELIKKAVELNASDIHIEPQTNRVNCRFRIDGILQETAPLPREYDTAVISRIKIMASLDIAEKRLPQDGRIRLEIGRRSVDLRVSTFPTLHGENLVIRLLDKSRSLLHLEELGMSLDTLKTFAEIIQKPHGIILVTGPTGSGKTTTLYAVLNQINSVDKNIMTLEDPIEYEVDSVRQSQVNPKAGLTFATGLRSIVRQDPDIIMIGEIRDRETAEIAIHAALTGHLVFSTLHTNSAVAAAVRLIDMGVEPFLVSSALTCVLSQRLVRLLCPACRESYVPTQEILDKLKLKSVSAEEIRFYREKGCPECRHSGYSGRIGIYEMFVPDEEIKRMIEKKAAANEVHEAALKKGMKSLREDAIDKLRAGITSLAEILRVTQEQ